MKTCPHCEDARPKRTYRWFILTSRRKGYAPVLICSACDNTKDWPRYKQLEPAK